MLINEQSLEKVMVFIHYSLAPTAVNLLLVNVLIQGVKIKSRSFCLSHNTQVSTAASQVCVIQRNEKQQNSVLSQYCPTKLCLLCL